MDEHGTAEDHDHEGAAGSTSKRNLALVSVLNLLGFGAELAGGLLFGSVALLSDAVHMLFDSLAYVMAFAASFLADHYGESDEWSYGLHRLEPFAAFLNGLLLLPMVGFVLWKSYQRYLDPVAIGTGPTLAVAAGGLLVNVGSVYVLQGGEMSLNERGAFYHLLGDAGGSVAVIVSTVVVEVTGVRVVDPLTAAFIAVLVTWSAGKVLRGSGDVFLHRTRLDLAAVRRDVESLDGVETVADVHAWRICSRITIATARVVVTVDTLDDAKKLNRRIHRTLAEWDVDHATVELLPEPVDESARLDSHTH